MSAHLFNGFSHETVDFLTGLKTDNSRQYFEANRSLYDNYFMRDAAGFVDAMGETLRTLSAGIEAIPKRDKSIFRIHRDTRFSPDKRPFKTHMGLFFWEGPGKKMENSGFYFHLEPEKLFLGVGMHTFPPDFMKTYREAVVDDVLGKSMIEAVNQSTANTKFELGWKKYKKTPRGFDPDHPRAEYLLHGGLGVSYEEPFSDRIHSPDIVDYVFSFFQEMAPIHFWLRDLTFKHAGL